MNERYILQKSTVQDGWWTLTDTESQLVCRFKEHEFNKTQNFTFLEDDTEVLARYSADEIAELANGIASWGSTFHYNVLMPIVEIPARLQIGREVAYYRGLRGMTQRELAEASGVNYSNIAKIEMGKYNVSVDILGKIANALDVKLGLFFL